MIFSANGVLSILAAYVNIITLVSFLHLSTETTQKFAKHGIVKAAMLFSFAFSVIGAKFPCLIATALFFIFEVKNFVRDSTEAIKSRDDA
jgi:hypothetical protein